MDRRSHNKLQVEGERWSDGIEKKRATVALVVLGYRFAPQLAFSLAPQLSDRLRQLNLQANCHRPNRPGPEREPVNNAG